jgi:hypothetical protein
MYVLCINLYTLSKLQSSFRNTLYNVIAERPSARLSTLPCFSQMARRRRKLEKAFSAVLTIRLL